jgi:glycosyltransferase involved in cell wall biosynthesis
MSRILLLADAGATTGFSRVSHSIGDRLIRDYGHEIHCLAVNYDGDAGRWDTAIKLYLPNKNRPTDIYGQGRFIEMLAEVMPDLVIMINDPYVILKFLFRNKFDPDFILARTRPIIAYMPVDGTNQPPAWGHIPELVAGIEPIAGGTGPRLYPVAMTNFGQKLFGQDMIYHGVDHDRFRPISPEDPLTLSTGVVVTSKEEAKAVFGIPPDGLLALRVDRNSIRKNFGDTWRALDPVMERHSNLYAWFHCKAEGDQLELPQLFSRNLKTAQRYYYPGSFSTKSGWQENDLIALYNAADLFISTSWGEGFGLTLAEASACALPIVAQDVSSITEVVGPGGILLKPERLTAVESGQDQWLPDVKKFTIAIERLVASASLRKSLGEAGRSHVVSTFSWDEAARKFDELITRVAQENPVTPTLELNGDDDAPDDDPGS